MVSEMPRSVPDEIAVLIYSGWGDIASFARELELQHRHLKYTTVYSVLIRSSHDALRAPRSLAIGLRADFDHVARILILKDPAAKRLQLTELMQSASIGSVSELARISKMHRTDIQAILSGKRTFSNLENIVRICDKLGLSLARFQQIYSNDLAEVS